MRGAAGSPTGGVARSSTRDSHRPSKPGRVRIPGVSDRGQSGIDFVVGFGIFFLTLSFVVVLIPELLAPFGAQEGPVVADRAVETLASDLLAANATGVLDQTCTTEFFAGSGSTCSFDAAESTGAIVGISGEHSLNVTLERDVDGDGTAEVDLARGREPPGDTQSVRSARRVVTLDGEAYFLELRAW